MKPYLLIYSIFLFLHFSVKSQNGVERLIDYYENSDMDFFIEKAKQRITEQYKWHCQRDSIFKSHTLSPILDFDQNNTVPILNIQFINTKSYSYVDNIYDYIKVDSLWTFSFARVDEKMELYSIANFPSPFTCYLDIEDRKSKRLIKRIKEQNAELILYCTALDGGFHKNYQNGFMYIKENAIYLYDRFDGKSYELNNYLRLFFSLNEIRSLNFTCTPLMLQKNGEGTARPID